MKAWDIVRNLSAGKDNPANYFIFFKKRKDKIWGFDFADMRICEFNDIKVENTNINIINLIKDNTGLDLDSKVLINQFYEYKNKEEF